MKATYYVRFIAILVLALQVSSCAWFHRDKCDGKDCDTPELLKAQTTNKTWYCYGKQDSESWDCVDKSMPSRIVAIDPDAGVEAPAPADAPTPATGKPRPLYDASNSILNEDKDHYTVQLISSPDKKDIEDYAMIHGVDNPSYVLINDADEPTYILLLGFYDDQDKALNAKDKWRRTHRLKVEPWVRQLGPLQDAIKKANKN